jgi:uncharacterized protein RhaS with RHS repeats
MLYSYEYRYDLAGNLVQSEKSYATASLNRTVTNTYDDASRLRFETVTDGSGQTITEYRYDASHNRTVMEVTRPGAGPELILCVQQSESARNCDGPGWDDLVWI